MNIFADVNARITTAARSACSRRTVLRCARPVAPRRGRAAARCHPRRSRHQRRAWCWPRPPKMNPRDIAERLARSCAGRSRCRRGRGGRARASSISRSSRLLARRWCRDPRARARDYGRLDARRRQKVNVEYVSANPTGPMHVGHCRGAVFGDALANLLAFAGYDVTPNTTSTMPARRSMCSARSAFLRYREALGEDIGEIPAGLYPGDYLEPVGAGAGDGIRPRRCSRCPRTSGCPSCAGPRHRRDDGDDPRRTSPRSTSITTCSSPSARCTPASDEIRPAINDCAEGPHLRGQAAASPRARRRRLGRPRADAVPLDRVRRRHRPAR